MLRQPWTLTPKELTLEELKEEITRIDTLWELHLDQIKGGNDNAHRAKSMRAEQKRRPLLFKELISRSWSDLWSDL